MKQAAFVGLAALILVSSATAGDETYRLMHAKGNNEIEVARDLTKAECERLKADQKAVAQALGIQSDALGIGSITCLPESIFAD